MARAISNPDIALPSITSRIRLSKGVMSGVGYARAYADPRKPPMKVGGPGPLESHGRTEGKVRRRREAGR
jgi:hypothetical protein